jgi:ferritin-like metal-binding protein YciE
MKIDSLKRLYVHQLKDLYSAEKQLAEALPKLAEKVSSAELRTAMTEHLKETEQQIERLEKIFEGLEFSPSGERCAAMAGLVEEGEEAMEDPEDEDVRDAAIIAAAQRVEHYEIAGYGTVTTYAQMLGREADVKILQEILAEEKAADAKLNDIALNVVNPAAAEASA